MTGSLHVVCPHCDSVNRVPRTRLGENPVCGRCGESVLTGHPIVLTDGNFPTHVGRSDIPVLVDCWAAWCGPCQAMAPVFERAASVSEPRVRFAKLDTEANPQTAAALGIRSIPTLVLFHGGQERARISGAMSLKGLLDWLQRQTAHLGHAGGPGHGGRS